MKAIGLILTLALMGCATVGGYTTHGFEAELRVKSDPAAHSNEVYAASGGVLGLDKSSPRGVTFYTDGFGGMIGTFPSRSVDILLGDFVQVLFRPVGKVDGVNAFGGPATALTVDFVALRNLRTHEVYVVPGYENHAAKWRDGTLFAAR